jgi:hypothetical protein
VVQLPENCCNQDENDCQWMVRSCDNAAFASQTALAWMCEIDKVLISKLLRQGSECPKPMQDMDLSKLLKVDNPNGGRPLNAIPAETCYDILYYYAHEARGHEKRARAKELCRCMDKAGAAVFIYGMAGYKLTPTTNIQTSKPNQIEIATFQIIGEIGKALGALCESFQAQSIQLTDVVQQSATGMKIQMQTEFNDMRGEIRHAANSIEGKVEAVQIALFDFNQTVEARITSEVAKQFDKRLRRQRKPQITTHLSDELYSKITDAASKIEMNLSAYVADILRNYHQ